MINPTAGYALAAGAARTVTYAYDAVGNRTSVTDSAVGSAVSYSPNNLNQYTAVGGTSHTYDGKGDLGGDGTWTYSYDHEGHLIGASKSGITISYAYDVQGRRLSKTVNGTVTQYVYNGDNLIEERNGSGTVQAQYIYEDQIDHPVQAIIGSNIYYFQQDGLGNVTALTDNSGGIVEQYTYDIYGKPTIKDGSGTTLSTSKTPFLFTGREYDSETGLYHYRARAYSADLGRFLQSDPINFDGGDTNIYRYCGNNPVNFADPSGKCIVLAFPIALLLLALLAGLSEKMFIDWVFSPAGQAAMQQLSSGASSLADAVGDALFNRPGAGSNLPTQGSPNSSAYADDGKGQGTGTIRDYGPDGKATTDYDTGHDHGSGDPHAHDWDWSGPAPVRGAGRSLRPGE